MIYIILYGSYYNEPKNIVASSISVIDKDKVIALKELWLSELGAIHNIVGLPISTFNSLQKLAEAINSDAICSVQL